MDTTRDSESADGIKELSVLKARLAEMEKELVKLSRPPHRARAPQSTDQPDARGGLTWGVQTGLDWPLGDSRWSLHVGVRYTRYAADPVYRYTDPNGAVFEQRKSIDLNPITLELGVAYHF